jgi:hypothetical protein
MAVFLRLPHRCRFCGHFYPLEEFVGGGPETGYCLKCYSDLAMKIALLRGIRGCQECGTTFELLTARAGGADVRMRMYAKDGIWQLLCGACGDEYERKRLDMFGATPYLGRKQRDA